MPVTTGKPKRSRAVQREDTRIAILDATIASLIEDGHAATTTRGVAERAGLSQGALQHHYPTRAGLIDAAIRRLADQSAQAVVESYSGTTGPERERVAELVDDFWGLAQVAPLSVGFEFLAAARTDPEMAATVAHLVEHIEATIFTVARQVLGELADRPGARDWMRLTVITIAGVLLTASVPAAATLVPDWSTVRRHIMTSFDSWRAGQH
ncbi:TetR/AcrR family transcriptional regulator [Nocardia huaxiensis]|uniref:TetR/AcrR family transcriptional regulator n=1 Tax=Nocardia huaxiensis TaxID=2755382 RepID=A0A7D6V7I0_9NOCA|nr:TetR/AcrR family transcriptional regulator [Nocardia huaxiensis]QLY29541.1 TetR/AcrR family transcriptional regulator [Nocardia huaxiensis]